MRAAVRGGAAVRLPARNMPRAGPRRNCCPQAQYRSFEARRTLTLPMRGDNPAFPVEHYLQDAESIVAMSFPDVHRRRKLSDDTWRVHMEPMPFLWLTLRVTCTLRAWGDGRLLSLEGRHMHIDGMPPELGLADGVKLKVDGALAARRTPPAVRGGAGRLAVAGNVSLGIAAEVPDVIALYPGLDFTVNSILALILERLEGSIRKGFIEDYDRWQRKRAKEVLDLERRGAAGPVTSLPPAARSP